MSGANRPERGANQHMGVPRGGGYYIYCIVGGEHRNPEIGVCRFAGSGQLTVVVSPSGMKSK